MNMCTFLLAFLKNIGFLSENVLQSDRVTFFFLELKFGQFWLRALSLCDCAGFSTKLT